MRSSIIALALAGCCLAAVLPGCASKAPEPVAAPRTYSPPPSYPSPDYPPQPAQPAAPGGAALSERPLPAQAPTPPSGPRPGGAPNLGALFQVMDTNHDGRVSFEEWRAFHDREFRLKDKDGDGFLSREEFTAPPSRPIGPPGDKRPPGAP